MAGDTARIAGEILQPGTMAILSPGVTVPVEAGPGSYIMLAGGQAMDGPRTINWNFVASEKAAINAAREDWRASIAAGFKTTRFSLPEGETGPVPLPEDQQPPG